MNHVIFILLTFSVFFSCKKREEKSNLQEAGAGHIDNKAWFERFDATFSPELVSSAVLRIMEIGHIRNTNLISNLKNWPNDAIEALPNRRSHPFFTGIGSGFFISSDGFGLTNYHVIESCLGYNSRKKASFSKCSNYKAILGTAYNADNYALSKLEVKINNALVDIANKNIEKLRSNGVNLNAGLNNEVKARIYHETMKMVPNEQVYDVCAVSQNGSSFDAVLIKLVPEGQSCAASTRNHSWFRWPRANQVTGLQSGTRLFSAGFGSYSSLYSDHKRDSKADFFDNMKVNFATGIFDRLEGSDLKTTTDKSVYKNDENFEAIDGNVGHSGSVVFLNSRESERPVAIGVHYKGDQDVRRKGQTSVSLHSVERAYFKSNDCLQQANTGRQSLSECLKE